jgi:hypothetical protein
MGVTTANPPADSTVACTSTGPRTVSIESNLKASAEPPTTTASTTWPVTRAPAGTTTLPFGARSGAFTRAANASPGRLSSAASDCSSSASNSVPAST